MMTMQWVKNGYFCLLHYMYCFVLQKFHYLIPEEQDKII